MFGDRMHVGASDFYKNVYCADAYKTPRYKGQELCEDDRDPTKLFLKKVGPIFEPQDLEHFVKYCEGCTPVDAEERTDDVFREYLFSGLTYFPIHFDEAGKASWKFKGNLLNAEVPPEIEKTVKIGLERFGKEMGWRNVTRVIACNVACNYLPVGKEITLLDWHADMRVDHSLVVSLSNSRADTSGWSGGAFCYAVDGRVMPQYGVKNKHHYADMRDSDHPTWKMPTSQNEAVLFSNKGSLHFVEPITAYSKKGSTHVSRIILSYFEMADI
jgi:hypothetical protein